MSRHEPRHLPVPVAVVGGVLALLLLLPSPADAAPSLSVSRQDGLSPDGQTVTISGSGFDTTKGIYVAYCVTPEPGQLPSPCGGGVDTSGTGGASVWISDNPPAYGDGLVEPFGPGGSFTVTLRATPTIGDVDCRVSSCAVVTRADHLRTSDRSQDVVVPVTFAGPPEHAADEPAQPPVPAQPDEPTEPSPPAQPEEATQRHGSDEDAAADPSSTPSAPADDTTDRDAGDMPERTRPEQPPHEQANGDLDTGAHEDARDDDAAGNGDDADGTQVLAASRGPGASTALAAVAAVLAVMGTTVGWWFRRRRVDHLAPAGGRAAPNGVDGPAR